MMCNYIQYCVTRDIPPVDQNYRLNYIVPAAFVLKLLCDWTQNRALNGDIATKIYWLNNQYQYTFSTV